MKRIVLAFSVAQTLLLGACADCLPGPHGNPPTGHQPGKADLFRCSANSCPLIPVNIQVVDGKCTVPFLFQRVEVEGGVTAHFTLAALTPEFMFRFTDPKNEVRTDDPARNQPGIDIHYLGFTPVFKVEYSGRSVISDRAQSTKDFNTARYAVTAIAGASNKNLDYPFKIHAEWSANQGATWSACEETDPFIANN